MARNNKTNAKETRTDNLSIEQRKYTMAMVQSRNTAPEIKVRKAIHRLGYRFRLHRIDLPGKPDIVFPSRKKVIFVHGCFWHGHNCNAGLKAPKTNIEYWNNKLSKNHIRDKENQKKLIEMGWGVQVIWECEIKEEINLINTLIEFIEERI